MITLHAGLAQKFRNRRHFDRSWVKYQELRGAIFKNLYIMKFSIYVIGIYTFYLNCLWLSGLPNFVSYLFFSSEKFSAFSSSNTAPLCLMSLEFQFNLSLLLYISLSLWTVFWRVSLDLSSNIINLTSAFPKLVFNLSISFFKCLFQTFFLNWENVTQFRKVQNINGEGNENPLQCSFLENSWRATVHGARESDPTKGPTLSLSQLNN